MTLSATKREIIERAQSRVLEGLGDKLYEVEPPKSDVAVQKAKHWYQEVADSFFNPQEDVGANLPWAFTEWFKMRPGDVTAWAGINGHGKSLLLNMVAMSVLDQGHPTLIASYEMRPIETLARMVRQWVGVEEPSEEYVLKFFKWTERTQLWLHQNVGSVTPQQVMGLIRYGTEHYGIRHFIIDSLLKCGIAPDDYNKQKVFIDRLSQHAKDTDTHIHLVVHARKGKTEHDRIGKWDIKGAGEISDLVDNVAVVWRNKAKEEAVRVGDLSDDVLAKPDCILSIEKQRHGKEGVILLWYKPGSEQFVASKRSHAITFGDE